MPSNVSRTARRVAALLLAFCAAGTATAQGTSGVLPVEAFFAPAKLQDAEISPNGRWMAALTSVPGRRIGIQVFDLEGKETSRFIEASPKDNVASFRWASDDYILFSVYSPLDRSLQREGNGLLAVRRDGTGLRLLINREFENEDPLKKRRYLDPDHAFLALGAPGSNEIIVGQLFVDVRGELSHVVPRVLNITNGNVRTMLDNAPRADTWWFDAKGRARVARHTKDGVSTTWWADAAGAWREIAKAPAFEQPFIPLYVDGDNELVVSTADASGSLELRRFDFASGKPSPAMLLNTPGFDGEPLVRADPRTGRVLGLEVTSDAVNPVWFNPTLKALQQKADAKFPDNVNRLSCGACEDPQAVLVYTYSDRDPGNFVLWRPKEDKWQLLGEVRPEVTPARMAPLEFHRIKARDNEDLPVWVTRPLSQHAKGAKPAPAVVLVHGGPWIRGVTWGWREEAQFLASRGYVVIEPEFRGSRGYGERHFRAGWKQWGRAMQDDVTDALRFAVKEGWVDASRVCIMGGSYGGYSTLIGLVRDPDQYRCGIAMAAVSEPRNLYEYHWSDSSREARSYGLPLTLGDKVKDADILAAASAVRQADKIKAPLLLVHGARDRRVPIEHAELMLDALRKAGKSVEWVRYADEGHIFFYDENRYDYYRKVEAFLAKHLK